MNLRPERQQHIKENIQETARENSGDRPCRTQQGLWLFSEVVEEPTTFLTGADKIRC